MLAVSLTEKVTEAINGMVLSQNALVSQDDVKKLLNYCDRLSFLKRGVATLNDEDISKIQIASFMTMFLQPRWISYDLSDWTCPNLKLVNDYQIPSADEICDSSQEFNAICARIARRAKVNMTLTAVDSFIKEASIEDRKGKVSVNGRVQATYNYGYLPTPVVKEWSVIVGEELYVKTYNEDTLINAFVKELTNVKTLDSGVKTE